MSTSTPEPRPRPQYGEYATPQQQAEIVAKSMPPVSPLLVPSDHAESVPVPSGVVEAESTEQKTRPRRWDRAISIALLAYGLVTVLGSFAQFSDVPAVIGQVYDAQSIGTFTSDAAAAAAGIVIIIANVVLFALATWLTVRRLMAGRLAFWVPITAGAVAVVIGFVALGVVIAGDPAFVSYVQAMSVPPT